MSYRRNSNNIFTDSESEQDANHDSAPSSPSSQSSSLASSTGILPSPSHHPMQLQSETDDEIILSPQGSLSPINSVEEEAFEEDQQDEEEEFEEVQQPQKHRQHLQHNYYDPDLYCLRRSNRRKEKESASVYVSMMWWPSLLTCVLLPVEWRGIRRDDIHNRRRSTREQLRRWLRRIYIIEPKKEIVQSPAIKEKR